MVEAAIESSDYLYATFWQRTGAAAFDAVLVHAFASARSIIPPGQAALYLSIFMPSLWWVYEVGTTARWGQTFGKILIGVQVRRTDFSRVGFGRALLRSAVSRGRTRRGWRRPASLWAACPCSTSFTWWA